VSAHEAATDEGVMARGGYYDHHSPTQGSAAEHDPRAVSPTYRLVVGLITRTA
jgi:hypothetical protein